MLDEFYERYILALEKENELESYLKNLDVSLGLEDIYKDIISYIGDGIKYVDIKLSIKAINNKFDNEITDMINVIDGECVLFMITRGNRCISIDKDGNCVSKYMDEFGTVVTTIEDDKATYSISLVNEMLLVEKAFVYGVDEFVNSFNEINDTKNRVLELVPKKK